MHEIGRPLVRKAYPTMAEAGITIPREDGRSTGGPALKATQSYTAEFGRTIHELWSRNHKDKAAELRDCRYPVPV